MAGQAVRFSVFQIFSFPGDTLKSCPDLTHPSLFHTPHDITGNLWASGDARAARGAAGGGENLKSWNSEILGPGWAVRTSGFQVFSFPGW